MSEENKQKSQQAAKGGAHIAKAGGKAVAASAREQGGRREHSCTKAQ